MKIAHTYAEEKILEDLHHFWRNDPGQRCLHIRLSHIEELEDDWFEYIIPFFQDYFDMEQTRIYFSHDHDIFILNRHLTQKRTDELILHTASYLPIGTIEVPHYSLYEIGVHFSTIYSICEQKLDKIKQQEQENPSSSTEQAQTDISRLMRLFDQKLIASIPQRRRNRERIEVLIIEDDNFIQRLIHSALHTRYNISSSLNGRDAITSYPRTAPDVVFLDIGLPDINGHEILQHILKIDPDAHIIMFSGYGNKENVMKAMDEGAKGFIQKPFQQQRLISLIEKSPHIKEKRIRQAKYFKEATLLEEFS